MKKILLSILLSTVLCFFGCSKSEDTSGLSQVLRIYATISGDQWVKNNRLYARFVVLPFDEFPKNPSKGQIDELISKVPTAKLDYGDALPYGDYVLIIKVSEHNESYPTLAGAYTYKKVTLSKSTVVKIMEFNQNAGKEYHEWKDGSLKTRN